jgi:hypothetical protein
VRAPLLQHAYATTWAAHTALPPNIGQKPLPVAAAVNGAQYAYVTVCDGPTGVRLETKATTATFHMWQLQEQAAQLIQAIAGATGLLRTRRAA